MIRQQTITLPWGNLAVSTIRTDKATCIRYALDDGRYVDMNLTQAKKMTSVISQQILTGEAATIDDLVARVGLQLQPPKAPN